MVNWGLEPTKIKNKKKLLKFNLKTFKINNIDKNVITKNK